MNLEIEAELIFEFPTFSNWVNKAPAKFKPYRMEVTICVDAGGNVIKNRLGFMAARDANLFPVQVFKLIKVHNTIEP